MAVAEASMPSRFKLLVVVAGLSLGFGLLSLVALRWLGFLGLPPVFFLILLLAGMPIGGLLSVRVKKLTNLSLGTITLISLGLSFLSTALFLLFVPGTGLNLDSNASPAVMMTRVFLRIALAAAMLLPLFVAYGLAEFAAYREGLAHRKNPSALVYSLNLLGLLLSFLGYRLGLMPLGTTGLLGLGFVLVTLCAWILQPRRWWVLGILAAIAGALLIPDLEPAVLKVLEVKTGNTTLKQWREPPNQVVHDGWTPYNRFSVVDTGTGLFGFYDGLYYWNYVRRQPSPVEQPERYRQFNLAFALLVKPGDRVAVFGAGGGIQVAAALKAGAKRVVAVEVIPQVLDILAGPLSERMEGLYNDPRVELVGQNARRFLATSDEKFDAIVLSSVETHLAGMRELFEPSQVMFTKEALAQMKAHLAPGGILAVSKYTQVDRLRTIFAIVFNELRSQGFLVRGYLQQADHSPAWHGDTAGALAQATQYLLLAQNGAGSVDALSAMDDKLQGANVVVVDSPPRSSPAFEISDDRAFATGLLVANLGLPSIALGLLTVAAILLILGAILWWLLRKMSAPSPAATLFRSLPLAAIAVGFNFMALETLMVYRLMDRLDVPMDATFMGMVAFAALAATGSLTLSRLSSGWLLLAVAVAGSFLTLSGFFLPGATLFAVILATVLSGSFFPRVLTVPKPKLADVYVWDAYGTLWGGLIALCMPIFTGFNWYQAFVGFAVLAAALAISPNPRSGSVLPGPRSGA